MPNTLVSSRHKIHFMISVLFVALLAYLFWTGSRYPALDEKAMMSGAIQLEDSLSFEANFPITADMTTVSRVFWSTLNWISTNKKGMTFGILFAAAFLTAISYLRVRSFAGGFANSVLGMAIGTPLGVCVNCAAPIAKGMYSGGLRAETTLSAMIASPTLNVVALTMTFSLLPFYMAVTKIGLSLIVILGAVPLICAVLPTREIAPIAPAANQWTAGELGQTDTSVGPLVAVIEVIAAFARNLWYIIKLTLPLMLLAGFLGALVATLLPQDLILGLPFSVWALILIALVGVFLPVPIAFDVVMAGALLGLGLAQGYVMALLFTLGSFSVYSFLIVSTSIGLRAAWMLTATIAGLGVLGGAGAEGYHRWQTARALELLLGENEPETPALWGAAMAASADPWYVSSADKDRIEITAQTFAASSEAADALFTRQEAIAIGIDKPVEFSMRDMWPPFWEGRSLSSGDIDNDGDLDVVIASTRFGVYIYKNNGLGDFARVEIPLDEMASWPIFNAVLVDMDNDGWRDLVLSVYQGGLWYWRNVDGVFGRETPVRLPNNEAAPLAMALSFADVDGDERLDFVVGNWAAGWYRRIPGEEARNRIIFNEPEGFRSVDLPGIPGETLSILLSDLDANGTMDLIVGNDFDIPDYFYLGDGTGNFTMIEHSSGLIEHTTTTTMAVKTGHLTGHSRPDIYLAQIAGRSSGVSATLKMRDLDLYCDAVVDVEAKDTCIRNMAIKQWYKSGNNFDPTYAGNCLELDEAERDECRAMLVKDLAIQKRDPQLCALIAKDQVIPRAYCDLNFLPSREPTTEEIALTHPQILRSNVLLEWGPDAYSDTAETRGLDVGGWSWDTKIEDFDLDGDQDVYIVNGTWVPNEVSPSNLYFQNDGSGDFVEMSGPTGLEDYLMTASATAFDADGDGDLDIITHPVNGPIAHFRNNTQNRAIGFTLIDSLGQRDAIGAKITLKDALGNTQRREIVLGGGFMSFDAPRVHFGVGQAKEATEARILWPDGEETVITGPLYTGAMYLVERH